HLATAETALDVAAELLAEGLRDGSLPAAVYSDGFDLLVESGRWWWRLLETANGRSIDAGSTQFADELAAMLTTADDLDAFADAALELGRPESWRLHTHYPYDQEDFLAAFRGLAEAPGPGRTGDAYVGAYLGVAALVEQLPRDTASRLERLLARWSPVEAPPAGLVALIAAELPEDTDVPARTVPTLVVTRHRLAQLPDVGTDQTGPTYRGLLPLPLVGMAALLAGHHEWAAAALGIGLALTPVAGAGVMAVKNALTRPRAWIREVHEDVAALVRAQPRFAGWLRDHAPVHDEDVEFLRSLFPAELLARQPMFAEAVIGLAARFLWMVNELYGP
ncbi:MAG: hypothetical protein ACRDXB_23455, partial [Actinomycetes bacterium]